ncbi:MAG: DUF4864 domain-containing protein [Gemmatimonadaceae bacterium]
MHRSLPRRARSTLRADAHRSRIAAAHRCRQRRPRRLVAAAVLLGTALVAPAGAPRAQQVPPTSAAAGRGDSIGATLGRPRPSPTLTPEQVVTIQLDALQHNDTPTPDFGIETTFRFASPANRVATGPLERFADVVKNSVYRPMINHRRVERGPMHVDGDQARQRVTVVTANGTRVAYMFILSRQRGGEYDRCWMTDGVARLNETGPRVDGLRSA